MGILDEGQEYSEENEYGIIPFIFPRFSYPYESVLNGLALDLINANELINNALSLINYVFRSDAFKVKTMTRERGKFDNKELEHRWDKIWAVTGSTQFGILDPQPNFTQMVDVIKFQMELINQQYGINIQWNLDSNASSGFALVVSNISLLEGWEQDVDICRVWEQDLYELEKIIMAVDGKVVSGDWPKALLVDFEEVKFPVNPAEEMAEWTWKFTNGLATKEDYLLYKNPDMKPDEIQARLDVIGVELSADNVVPTTAAELLLKKAK